MDVETFVVMIEVGTHTVVAAHIEAIEVVEHNRMDMDMRHKSVTTRRHLDRATKEATVGMDSEKMMRTQSLGRIEV